MDKKDFSDLENQIMSTVSSALKAIDFANLKKDINGKADYTLNTFKSKFSLYSEKFMRLNKKSKNDISKYISKKPAGTTSGVLYILFGLSGTLVYGSLILLFVMFKVLFSSFVLSSSYVFLVIATIFFIISVASLVKGISLRKRLQRFKKYVRFIEDNNYFLINDLAKFFNEKESFVLKDLNKMIDSGMFLEGHIDEEKTYFMLNDEIYNNYLNLKKEELAKEINEEKLKEEIDNQGKEDVESTIKIGRNYIEEIKIIRNDLCKEEIAIKLDKLVNIANQILGCVEKNPKKVQEVNKFINHYLPITIKLINSYKELNNQLVQGDNIKNAKIEIEKSIDLINNAFENLSDDLFEDVALDISTDISVLKTLFKQEGLTEEDFKK